MEEPTKEEYDRIKRDCQKLLVPEVRLERSSASLRLTTVSRKGAKASLLYGSLFLAGLVAFKKFTPLGRRLTFHPFAILGTAGFVAPFWVVGEQSVLFCQRSAFNKRKALVGDRFGKERFNRD